ncbi:MAG: phosphoadenylyl-sulfate reductase, partial [Jatrophihabitantaceae bacterium]
MGVPAADVAHFQGLARDAGRRFEGAPPEDVLRWAIDTFGDGFCIAASMSDALLIDLASRVRPDVNVVFLDTGYHFE